MYLFLFLVTQSPTPIDPLDGFRANLTSTEVTIEFIYREGMAASSQVCGGRVWKARSPIQLIEEFDKFHRAGRWEFDGKTERISENPSDTQMSKLREAMAKVGKGATELPGELPTQYLTDPDVTAALWPYSSRRVVVGPNLPEGAHHQVKGPYSWWGERFPADLDRVWKGVPNRVVLPGVHSGFATQDLLIRSNADEDAYLIAFDPSIGFIPRYSRVVLDRGTASINEMYLIDARPCSAGGFVPVEWISLRFDVPDFRKRYPDFDLQTTVVDCPQSRVSVRHFQITSWQDAKPEPRLWCDEGFSIVGWWNQEVTLPNGTTSLSLDEIKQLLGDRMNFRPPLALGSAINSAELQETRRPRSWKRWLVYGLLTAIGAALLVSTYRRRRAVRTLIVIAPILLLPGCQKVPLQLQLQFKFAEENLLVDKNHGVLQTSVVISNTGNCEMVIRDAQPSCTCTVAKEDSFPLRLKPREKAEVAVNLQKRYDSLAQQIIWTIDTDQGEIHCSSRIFMFPEAKMEPYQHFGVLGVGDSPVFKFLAQQIAMEQDALPEGSLQAPDGVRLTEKGVRSGRGPVAGFKFVERSYEVEITDPTIGNHRKDLLLATPDGETLASAMLSWQRVPPIRTFPERVLLADRRVRVFLHAKDKTIEFVRVLETPDGITATITSPKELSVAPLENAPPSIDGVIVIETDAPSDGIVRVPVVRYHTEKAVATSASESRSIGPDRPTISEGDPK